MKFYFKLQFKRIERWFLEIGLHPILGILLTFLGFILLSTLLFLNTELAPWVYFSLVFPILLKLNEKQRNEQLILLFNNSEKHHIRIIENLLIAFPFLLYLFYKQEFAIGLGLIPSSCVFAFFKFNLHSNWSIPTPFRRFPFENIIGFRMTFLYILFNYFLILKGIQVENSNLALVAFGALFFIILSFHLKPEPKYYVWIFDKKAKGFLIKKILTSIFCSLILILPAFLILISFIPEMLFAQVVITLTGNAFITFTILAKYSAFPNYMNLTQGILFALSLWFPPVLFVVAVLFYRKSISNLKAILE